jgi:hypothetical protein
MRDELSPDFKNPALYSHSNCIPAIFIFPFIDRYLEKKKCKNRIMKGFVLFLSFFQEFGCDNLMVRSSFKSIYPSIKNKYYKLKLKLFYFTLIWFYYQRRLRKFFVSIFFSYPPQKKKINRKTVLKKKKLNWLENSKEFPVRF